MDIVPVDVADRWQHFGDIWQPYAISGPARQCWGRAWPPRRQPRAPRRVHSLPLALLVLKLDRSGGVVVGLTPASSSALHTASPSTKAHPQLRRVLLSNLHPQDRLETLRWADIFIFPQIRSPEPFSPASPMLSSSEALFFSSLSLWVA